MALCAAVTLPADMRGAVPSSGRVEENDEWAHVDYRRDIVPGSALDFSGLGLQDAPAGKYGWLVSRNGHAEFEKRPGFAARFYGVNLCNTANYLPSNEVEQVTDRLVRLGYNAVRIHHHDNLWGEDEENRDALDRLVAACVRKGIYLTTDIYVSRRIPWRDLGVDRDGTADGTSAKLLMMTTDAGFDNWKRLARDFLMRQNRYTGRCLAEEPAMPFLVLINESSPHSNTGWSKARDIPAFQALWDEWLAEQRAVNPSAWPLAKAGELPKKGGWWDPSPESDMKAAFRAWCVMRFSRKATAFLRNELGVKAMLATDNNGPTLPSILKARADGGDYADFHFYTEHAGPASSADRKNAGLPLVSLFRNHNPLSGWRPVYRGAAFNRIWGHPLVVSESQMGGPNFNRAMAGLVTGTYAAIQDWTGIWTFALAHSRAKLFDGCAAAPGRFDLSLDPLMQATDRLPTLLFLRGDQPTPSAAFANVLPDGPDATGSAPSLSSRPEWIGRGLEWKSRLGVSFGNEPLPSGVKRVMARPSETPTDIPAPCGVAVDETKGSIVASGRRTAGGFVGADDVFDAGTLRANVRGHGALVAAAALDGADLSESSRILVWHLTDLHGTGFAWGGRVMKDGPRTGILSWGNHRLLAHVGEADVSLALADAQLRKVYALGTDGKREHEMPARIENGRLSFTASVRQPFGGCLYYEIVTVSRSD